MVQEELGRRGSPASVRAAGESLRIRYEGPTPHVSIVIPTRHSRTNLARLLPSLASTKYPRFDVLIIDNGGESVENQEWYDAHLTEVDATVVWWTAAPFNYSKVNNEAVRRTSGDVVVLLNDDTEIVDPLWLREMVGCLLQPGIGSMWCPASKRRRAHPARGGSDRSRRIRRQSLHRSRAGRLDDARLDGLVSELRRRDRSLRRGAPARIGSGSVGSTSDSS